MANGIVNSRTMRVTLDTTTGLTADVYVLCEFTIAHVGWEMDNTGWIVEFPGGTRHFATTSHGGDPYVADLKELEAAFINHRSWHFWIADALTVLKGEKK